MFAYTNNVLERQYAKLKTKIKARPDLETYPRLL